eukprot:89775-Rhodomonas_salina.1
MRTGGGGEEEEGGGGERVESSPSASSQRYSRLHRHFPATCEPYVRPEVLCPMLLCPMPAISVPYASARLQYYPTPGCMSYARMSYPLARYLSAVCTYARTAAIAVPIRVMHGTGDAMSGNEITYGAMCLRVLRNARY